MWIFRILRNTYLTSRSGLAAFRTVALEDQLGDDEESGSRLYPEGAIDRETPEINLLRLSDRAAIQAAMEKLSPALLEVLLLCDVEEMKYREIASVLEIPIGTVMSRVARARTSLREALQISLVPREFAHNRSSFFFSSELARRWRVADRTIGQRKPASRRLSCVYLRRPRTKSVEVSPPQRLVNGVHPHNICRSA